MSLQNSFQKRALMRARLPTKWSVSRIFYLTTEGRISHFKQIHLKPNCEYKVNWGVNAYNEWKNYRLETYQYNYPIYAADLNDLSNLKKDNLCHSLCHFVPEVTKQKSVGQYPGHTLYQLVAAIQKYLNVKKIDWLKENILILKM